RVRTGAPHARDSFPIARTVLHLGPDEVVTGVGHRAVSGWISRVKHGAARDLAALLQLELDRVPNGLRGRGRRERATVLPGLRIEGALVHGAWWRTGAGVAVLAGRRRERKSCCRSLGGGVRCLGRGRGRRCGRGRYLARVSA